MALHFCAMLILYCNDALLGRQFFRKVQGPSHDSNLRSARDVDRFIARDAKMTRLGDKQAGTVIAGSAQAELAERAQMDEELSDEGESNAVVGARWGAP